MARNGFRIFDSDTHVGPSMNVLDQYLASAEKARLADWEEWKETNPRTGRITYTKGGRSYQRRLGHGAAEATLVAASACGVGDPAGTRIGLLPLFPIG